MSDAPIDELERARRRGRPPAAVPFPRVPLELGDVERPPARPPAPFLLELERQAAEALEERAR